MTLVTWLALFGGAFLAATILPFSSEIAVVGAVATSEPGWLIVFVATAGNTLGAVVNWWLGLFIERFRGKRWFPAGEKELARAQAWFQRYGKWSLLLAWLPVVGDALTIVAGTMRVPLLPFTVLVAIGKAGRYALVVYLASQAL